MRCFFLSILLLATGTVQAQKIRFTDTSNKWKLVQVGGDYGWIVAFQRLAAFNLDTSIAGKEYRRLEYLQSSHQLAVREDTLSDKLYFRFVTPGFGGSFRTDSLEHLFFDYNLKVGDTLQVAFGLFKCTHLVLAVDSVQLGGTYHKKWRMGLIAKSPSMFSILGYEFIEAIGTPSGPLFSVFPYEFESFMQLRCFTNNGVQPLCNPAILLPSGVLPIKMGVQTVRYFDNDSSCVLKPVSVSVTAIPPIIVPVLSPNPGGKESILSMPASIKKSCLSVTDILGRSVARVSFDKTTAFPIGQYISTPGTYYYTLQDAATGQQYTGRFIFQ